MQDKAVSEDLVEVPLRDRVFRAFLFVATVIILIFLGRIAYLSLIRGEFYRARAEANMVEVKIISAPRGAIYDRFGKALAVNRPDFEVFLSFRDLPKDVAMRDAALRDIGAVLNIPEEELREKIAQFPWDTGDYLFLAEHLSEEQVFLISSRVIPGLKVEQGFRREYAAPVAFSHVLGYTGYTTPEDLEQNTNLSFSDRVGRDGLELIYDSYLRGRNGEEWVFRTAKGMETERKTAVLPEEGAALYTFLDKDLQEFFYNRLRSAIRDLGSNAGVGIAMDPQSGEVLALTNIPGFDADRLGEYLHESNRPFFNRAVAGLYSPGSSIKPLHAIAALTEGVITPDKELYSPGYLDVQNPYNPDRVSRFFDWKPHGWVDIRSALARSSNVYFYEVGGGFGAQVGLGISRLRDWWHTFRLDQKTGIDIPQETAGFLPSPEWKEDRFGTPWRLGDTYNVSIGQGDLLLTPIALLNYISAIANGGMIYRPRVGKAVIGADGRTLAENNVEVLADISGDISGAIGPVRAGMVDAVRKPYGTAYLLHDLPISVAAKTGSSQVENNKKTNAFFVGYAPVENPEIAILVLIENAREGSLNAVPVARDTFLWYYENRMKNRAENQGRKK